jgi:hypothetical protein
MKETEQVYTIMDFYYYDIQKCISLCDKGTLWGIAKLTKETLSFLTADVYCNSIISDRDDVCYTKFWDFTAMFRTPSYHSVGHRPNKTVQKWININIINTFIICYKRVFLFWSTKQADVPVTLKGLPCLESQPNDWLSWLRHSMVFFSLYR